MFCTKCGNQVSGNFCNNCGTPINSQPNYVPIQQQSALSCPICHSHNVSVTLQQVSSKTSTKGNGCLWAIGRALLIICTCGLWLFVGKHKATSKTTITNKTVKICQNCGHSW